MENAITVFGHISEELDLSTDIQNTDSNNMECIEVLAAMEGPLENVGVKEDVEDSFVAVAEGTTLLVPRAAGIVTTLIRSDQDVKAYVLDAKKYGGLIGMTMKTPTEKMTFDACAITCTDFKRRGKEITFGSIEVSGCLGVSGTIPLASMRFPKHGWTLIWDWGVAQLYGRLSGSRKKCIKWQIETPAGRKEDYLCGS